MGVPKKKDIDKEAQVLDENDSRERNIDFESDDLSSHQLTIDRKKNKTASFTASIVQGEASKNDREVEFDFTNETSGGIAIGLGKKAKKEPTESVQIDAKELIEFEDEELKTTGLRLGKVEASENDSSHVEKKIAVDSEVEFENVEGLDNIIELSSSRPDRPDIEIEEFDSSQSLAGLELGTMGEGSGKERDIPNTIEEEELLKEYRAFSENLAKDPYFDKTRIDYPRIMGDYFLYDHMADGGMAKICRGQYVGDYAPVSQDQYLVVKMIKEEFSNHTEYIQMFMDEIHVAFNFKHKNIAGMFDYGKAEKQLFVSMEYIHGTDLMDIIDDLFASGKQIPIPLALHIAIEVCRGLHYVHNFKDPQTNADLHIVHRDISPHNIMVGYDGQVKVIDFGIAKSDNSQQKEEEGTVKGKINYFAPEYLEGNEIDHRYDQFAVGLTLFEMLTGKKTFDHGDQIKTLKAIIECKPKKISALNKNASPELDKLISKVLSKSPKNRFSDMNEMANTLEAFTARHFPDYDCKQELKNLLTGLYRNAYQKDCKLFENWATISTEKIKENILKIKDYETRLNSMKEKKGNTEIILDFGFDKKIISVLNKASMKQGLQLDMRNRDKRRREIQRRARERQFALVALLGGKAKSREDRESSRSVREQLEFFFGYRTIMVLIIGLFSINYCLDNLPQKRNDNIAFVKWGLEGLGFDRYEKIVGFDHANLRDFKIYYKESIKYKIGSEILGHKYNYQIFMTDEQIEERVEKRKRDIELKEEAKVIEDNKKFLKKLRGELFLKKINTLKSIEHHISLRSLKELPDIPKKIESIPVKKSPPIAIKRTEPMPVVKTIKKQNEKESTVETVKPVRVKTIQPKRVIPVVLNKEEPIARKPAAIDPKVKITTKVEKKVETKLVVNDLKAKFKELEKEENKTFFDNIIDFIKTRRVVAWIFKD